MADLAHAPRAWRRAGPWQGVLGTERTGREDGPAGLVLRAQESHLATVIARSGRVVTLSARLASALGIVPPATPRIVRGPEIDLIWSGQDQWLARSAHPDLAARLTSVVGETAAISDQSGSRAVIQLTGPRVRDVLAKGCMVDLHPLVFREGEAATTSIAHIGVQIWLLEGGATFEVAVPRSYAGSFWSWLSASAAEFGCEIAQ